MTHMLSPSSALVGLTTLAAFLVYHFVLHPLFFSPLSRIPNIHWSAPITSLWILHVRYRNRENKTLLEGHQRLGPIIRVGPADISIDDGEGVQIVYGGGFEKTQWYSVFDNYGVPCMFSERPAKAHSARKRMISNVYSKTYIQSSKAADAQAHVLIFNRLLPILTASAAKSQAPHGLNVYSLFLATTMDFIGAYIWGIKNGTDFLNNVAVREHWLELYKARNSHGFFAQELPWLTWFLGKIWLSPFPHWVHLANKELEEWCQQRCDDAMQFNATTTSPGVAPEDTPVVLQAVISGLHREAATNGKESVIFNTAIQNHNPTVYSELFDHILAGQETSGTTLTYLAWHLSRNHDVQKQLQRELNSLEPGIQLQRGQRPSAPDPKHLDALPLLHAVIMETMRLNAPLPGAQPREAPYPGCQIGKYTVPGGTRVAATGFALHRADDVYPDPEQWDPARWINSQEVEVEAQKARARSFWAFSSGGRMCIGNNFAMHEMKLVIAAIYSNFSTHVVDDRGMEQVGNYSARPASEQLYLRFEPVDPSRES